ncbi:hypothetical protein, partial [Saccharomonospora sp. CUA-673]|uniref:hypothetical protein n=1 Tax=Saccharomonospora sp. CUA-673 TaxID=1904969 RepID=UPI001C9E9CB7
MSLCRSEYLVSPPAANDAPGSRMVCTEEQLSRPVDEDLLGGCGLGVVVRSFDEFSVLELR